MHLSLQVMTSWTPQRMALVSIFCTTLPIMITLHIHLSQYYGFHAWWMQYVLFFHYLTSESFSISDSQEARSCSCSLWFIFPTGIQFLSKIYQRNLGWNATWICERYAQSWDKFSPWSIFSSQCSVLHMDHSIAFPSEYDERYVSST